MTRRLLTALPLLAVLMALGAGSAPAVDLTAYYPDLRTVVPHHLNLVNSQQRDILRFTNGIANTGGGPWAMRPNPPPSQATTTTTAMQQIRDSAFADLCGTEKKNAPGCYHLLAEFPRSVFEFHPAHNHWHVGKVALFEVHSGTPEGPVVGGNALKVGFCLIDWYRLDGNASTSQRAFWECQTSFQGVSVGWVDQYHHELEGQSVDLTTVPDGDNYYLVSTSNYDRLFLEQNYDNNSAWVKFRLYGSATGNRKVEVTGHSDCDSPGLCGTNTPNR